MRRSFAAALFLCAVFAGLFASTDADAKPRKYKATLHDLVAHVDDSRYLGQGGGAEFQPVRGLKRAGRTVARKAARATVKTAKVVVASADATADGLLDTAAGSANIVHGYAKYLTRQTGAERGLQPSLQKVIAELRAEHGAASVKVEGGISRRAVRGMPRIRSCHYDGSAFDGRLSAAAMSSARKRVDVGLITYSGAMSHVHVSVCPRERGVRSHMVVNKYGVPLRFAKKKKKRVRYARVH